MKKLLLVLVVMVFTFTITMAQTDYLQFEVMSVTPKPDKLDLFKKGMAAHNKKFHNADPYKAGVSYIITGPNSGSYNWVMGPTTWTQMDNRPGKGDHDMDWEKNVVPYVASFGEVSYWRVNKDVIYQPEGAASLPIGRLWFNYVKPGQMNRYVEQMKKVMAVNAKRKSRNSFMLATRVGPSNGPGAVTINNYANWAAMDAAGNFRKDFEEMYGVGSWDAFMEELDLSIERAMTFEELSQDEPELSGGN